MKTSGDSGGEQRNVAWKWWPGPPKKLGRVCRKNNQWPRFRTNFGGWKSHDFPTKIHNILLMAKILHQLRLAVYRIICRVFYIPGGWPWDFRSIKSICCNLGWFLGSIWVAWIDFLKPDFGFHARLGGGVNPRLKRLDALGNLSKMSAGYTAHSIGITVCGCLWTNEHRISIRFWPLLQSFSSHQFESLHYCS